MVSYGIRDVKGASGLYSVAIIRLVGSMPSNSLHQESLLGIIRDYSRPMLPLPAKVPSRLMPLENIRAVVFDVYGTLFLSSVGDISLASEENRESAMLELFANESLVLSDEAHHLSNRFYAAVKARQEVRKQDGVAYPEVEIRAVWRDLLEALHSEGQLKGMPDERQLERIALRFECLVNPVWPAPEAERILWKLNREGKLLGIISNAQFYTPLLFERFFSQRLEELGMAAHRCVWSYELLEAKPSVALYERSAQAFKKHHEIAPEQVLYIGNDMLKDIYPASRVGFKTALYAGDRRSLRLREDAPECQGLEPDIVLTHWTELLDCLV